MNQLPDELWFQIATHLSYKDLGRLSLTCWLLYSITNDERIWQKLYFETLGEYGQLAYIHLKASSFKAKYLEYLDRARFFGAGVDGPPEHGWGVTPNAQDDEKGALPSPSYELLPLKGVTMVACGGAHSLVLTYEQRVYVSGSNVLGQLGTGDLQSRKQLTPLHSLPKVRFIAAGFAFSMFITLDHQVFSTGAAQNGRAGVATQTISSHTIEGFAFLTQPTRAFVDQNLIFAKISLGSGHGLGLTFDGDVYSWGRNDTGQLGVEARISEVRNDFLRSVPNTESGHIALKVTNSSWKAKQIVASSYTSAAVSTEGIAYFWGEMSGPLPKKISDQKMHSVFDLFTPLIAVSDEKVARIFTLQGAYQSFLGPKFTEMQSKYGAWITFLINNWPAFSPLTLSTKLLFLEGSRDKNFALICCLTCND